MHDSFLVLVVEALNLMHPRFAAAHGLVYPEDETAGPVAARKSRERSFVMEFYHEFRRMWDQAITVQRGLGHIMIQADPDAVGARTPDLFVLDARRAWRARYAPRGGVVRVRIQPGRSRRSHAARPLPRQPRLPACGERLSSAAARNSWKVNCRPLTA